MGIDQQTVQDTLKREQEVEEQFLKQVPDFVKWTSTVAAAAVLWIANSLDSLSQPARLASLASLLLLIISLIVAVFAIKRIVTACASRLNLARHATNLMLSEQAKSLSHLPGITSDQLDAIRKKGIEQRKLLIDAIEADQPYLDPKGFSTPVSWHVGLLIGALFFYILAQLLNTLYPTHC
jgi:hypothetical protein